MKLLSFPFFISPKPPNSRLNPKPFKASINTPPPDFDYRSAVLQESRALIARSHPELLDLADDGTLVVIEKRLFGPVPPWRAEFVEPETLWLVGTSHISSRSADDVERVLLAVRPDSVVVELCRSRNSCVSNVFVIKMGRSFQKT